MPVAPSGPVWNSDEFLGLLNTYEDEAKCDPFDQYIRFCDNCGLVPFRSLATIRTPLVAYSARLFFWCAQDTKKQMQPVIDFISQQELKLLQRLEAAPSELVTSTISNEIKRTFDNATKSIAPGEPKTVVGTAKVIVTMAVEIRNSFDLLTDADEEPREDVASTHDLVAFEILKRWFTLDPVIEEMQRCLIRLFETNCNRMTPEQRERIFPLPYKSSESDGQWFHERTHVTKSVPYVQPTCQAHEAETTTTFNMDIFNRARAGHEMKWYHAWDPTVADVIPSSDTDRADGLDAKEVVAHGIHFKEIKQNQRVQRVLAYLRPSVRLDIKVSDKHFVDTKGLQNQMTKWYSSTEYRELMDLCHQQRRELAYNVHLLRKLPDTPILTAVTYATDSLMTDTVCGLQPNHDFWLNDPNFLLVCHISFLLELDEPWPNLMFRERPPPGSKYDYLSVKADVTNMPRMTPEYCTARAKIVARHHFETQKERNRTPKPFDLTGLGCDHRFVNAYNTTFTELVQQR